MTKAFFDHPYLSGHHEPVRFEATAPDLIVEGEIPDDLAGVFYRNGPEPLYPTREGEYHWFDGDGMVYAFHIADGRASMCNRWVRTEKFELEKAAGKRLFGMFGNPMTSDPSCLVPEINGAISMQEWKDALWAKFFTGAPARQRQSVEQYKIVKRA